jgi:hypothetical protein
MNKYKIGIQCGSIGQRCGIATYSERLMNSLNKLKKDKDGNDVCVESYMFNIKAQKNTDLISIQYEPGLVSPDKLNYIIHKNVKNPCVVTVHHTGYLQSFYDSLDGFVFHSESQTVNKPWDYKIIEHPALVFPNKDKIELRKKYGLPLDKKILGTAGFIAGTGKELPMTVSCILNEIKDDEFLYLITSFWKGGDLGNKHDILKQIKESGKENQVRLDTDFVSEETLNEKMQACDLLWTWCLVGPNDIGSQSGIAADMYGTRRKLIVKDSAHYSFIGNQDKVEIGRPNPDDFAKDVFNVLRNSNLDDVQEPEWLSWEEKAKEYLSYFQEVLGE